MTASTLRISFIQGPLAWEDPAQNIVRMASLLPAPGTCDLLILPEMWATGFTLTPTQAAEAEGGPAWQWMRAAACETGAMICGSLAVEAKGIYYNRFYAVGPEGECARYDKKHLFSFSGEDKAYSPGTARTTFVVKNWQILPIICYDLRFPAWCRNTRDYDILLVVANWPEARIHHWDALIKARAIENQSYVIAVNRTGTDGHGLAYPGHSAVYDMNGDALISPGHAEGRFDTVLDLQALAAFRKRFPFLADRDSLSDIPA